MQIHLERQGNMKIAKAHCGIWWPKKTTDNPQEVTCKHCINRGLDYGKYKRP